MLKFKIIEDKNGYHWLEQDDERWPITPKAKQIIDDLQSENRRLRRLIKKES